MNSIRIQGHGRVVGGLQGKRIAAVVDEAPQARLLIRQRSKPWSGCNLVANRNGPAISSVLHCNNLQQRSRPSMPCCPEAEQKAAKSPMKASSAAMRLLC